MQTLFQKINPFLTTSATKLKKITSFFSTLPYKKSVASLLTFSVLLQASPFMDSNFLMGRIDLLAKEKSSDENLALILLDKEIAEKNPSLPGLRNQYSRELSTTKLLKRVERYAETIQKELVNTKVEIMLVDKTESPGKIAAFLKQAYFQNTDLFNNRKLAGVILVGDVPLPVVDSQTQRFVSVLPYTDFENPYYDYNLATDFFVEAQDSTPSKIDPEIWHGILNFNLTSPENQPATENTPNQPNQEDKALEQLAVYLDKNYLFYKKHPDFANFEKQIFYSEPHQEQLALTQLTYDNYQKYSQYLEEVTYGRFSSKLFAKITEGNTALQKAVQMATDQATANGQPAPNFNAADLYMEQPILANLSSALEAYSGALNKQVQNLVDTGRYEFNDIFSPITAIAQKDDYLAYYLRLVNQLVEDKIDSILEEVAADIVVPNGVKLSGEITYKNSNQTDQIKDFYFVNNAPTSNSIARQIGSIDPMVAAPIRSGQLSFSSHLSNGISNSTYIAKWTNWINGTPLADITSAEECRIYRGGGTNNPLDQTVKITRGLHSLNQQEVCFIPAEGPSEQEKFFTPYDPQKEGNHYLNSNYCSNFFGEKLRDDYRAVPVQSVSKSALTHESCFTLRPLQDFNEILDLTFAINTPENYAKSNVLTQASAITLETTSGNTLKLDQLLDSINSFKSAGRTSKDLNAWSYFLSRHSDDSTHSLTINNPSQLSDIKQIKLKTQSIHSNAASNQEPKKISSIVKHADPSDDIKEAIQKGATTQSLPINATRYVTFVDKNKKTQEIRYPNGFKSSSLAEFTTELQKIEEKLTQLNPEKNYTNALTGLITANPNQYNQEATKVTAININSLKNALSWRSFSLDQKYSSVYKTFLNQSDQEDLLGFPSSFEIAVINAGVTNNQLDLDIIPDKVNKDNNLGNDAENSQYLAELEDQILEEELDRNLHNRTSSDTSSTPADGCNASHGATENGIPLMKYPEYLTCWTQSLANLGFAFFIPTRAGLPTFKEAISNPEAEIHAIQIKLEKPAYTQAENATPEEGKALISLLDKDGKTIIGKPIMVTVNTSGAIELLEKQDMDSETGGTQIFVVGANTPVKFKINNSGPASLQVISDTKNSTNSFTIHRSLKLTSTKSSISAQANSQNSTEFSIQLKNEKNQPVDFSLPIPSLKNPSQGKITLLSPNPETVTPDSLAKEYKFQFTPSQTASTGSLEIIYPEIQTLEIPVSVKAGAPIKLFFKDLKSSIEADDTNTIHEIPVYIADKFNNQSTSSLQNINLKVSDLSKITLLTPQLNFQKGKATIRFKLKNFQSGNIFFIVEKQGLKSAIHKAEISNGIHKSEFASFISPALYYDIPAGMDFSNQILTNGKSQVISTVTTTPDITSPALYIHPNGAYQSPQNSPIELKTILSTPTPQTYSYTINDNKNQDLATIEITTSNLQNRGFLTTTSKEITKDGIYLQSDYITPSQTNPNLYLDTRESSENTPGNTPESTTQTSKPLFEITQQGTLSLKQDNLELMVFPHQQWFTLKLLDINSQTELATIIYAVSSSSIKVGAHSNNLNYSYTKGYTQSSSSKGKGFIFYSQSQLEEFKAPSNQKESILLFSAGVPAGKANLLSQKENSIILGDPIISLSQNPATSPSGFSLDVGNFIGKTDSDISQIVQFQNKIIISDKTGNISLADPTLDRFSKNILKIPNGIQKLLVTKNKSKPDSLVVLAAQACVNQDACLYELQFQNKEVISKNLEIQLPERAVDVIPFDSNSNGFHDLLVLDEKHTLYLIPKNPQTLKFQTQPITIGSLANYNLNSIPLITTEKQPNGTDNAGNRNSTTNKYPQIKVTLPEEVSEMGEPQKIIYFVPEINQSTQKVRYQKKEEEAETFEIDPLELLDLPSGLEAIEDRPETENTPTDEEKELAEHLQNQFGLGSTGASSSTGNQGGSSWSRNEGSSLKDMKQGVADFFKYTRCNNPGCIATPINKAFLVPSPPSSALPALGFGCAGVIPIWPPNPFQTCSTRMYISPTLTGSVVGATCFGAFPTGLCWETKLGDLGFVCNVVNDTVDMAKKVVNSATEVATSLNDASGGIITIGPKQNDTSDNLIVPGFPAIFTNWFSKQLEEIELKILDLPDLTLIYPSLDSLVGYVQPIEPENKLEEFQETEIYANFADTLASVASMPLINLTVEKHKIYYPYIPKEEDLMQYLLEYRNILYMNWLEFLATGERWGCYANSFYETFDVEEELKKGNFTTTLGHHMRGNPNIDQSKVEPCLKLSAAFEGFYLIFEANLEELKKYRDLPKDIFEVQNFVADYTVQALGYAELILDRSAGFLVANTKALKQWQKFFIDLQNLLKKLKLLLNIFIDLQVSCDTCQTNRTNLDFNLLLDLFLALPPDLPIIEMPKLVPDITLDVSSIDLGAEIVLPDFEFIPNRIKLPKPELFLIKFPSAIPVDLDLTLEKIGLKTLVALPKAPDISAIMLGLPPLPEFKIPELPVLPSPPDFSLTIGDFIYDIKANLDLISDALSIICMILDGLFPTSELLLNTKIEAMTNRGLTPILPIDTLGLSLQFPEVSYQYWDELKIISELTIDLNFPQLSDLSKEVVNIVNNYSNGLKAEVDIFLQNIQNAIPSGTIDLDLTKDIEIEGSLKLGTGLDQTLDLQSDNNTGLQSSINNLKSGIPDKIYLTATTRTYTPEEIRNYQPKYIGTPEYNSLLAQNQEISELKSYIASVNSNITDFTNPKPLIAQVSLAPEDLAMPELPANTSNTVTLNPDHGIYYLDTETETVEKLLAYYDKRATNITTALVDVDKDRDNDAFYTFGNKLFFKENLKNNSRKKHLTSNISITSELPEFSLTTLKKESVRLNSINQNIEIETPVHLSDSVLVVDVFTAHLEAPIKAGRFILAAPEQEQEAKTIKKQGFNKVEYLNLLPINKLPLDNQHYRINIGIYNPQTKNIELLYKSLPVTPNICGDFVPPQFGSQIPNTVQASLFQPILLDLSDITDEESGVGDIYLDINNDGIRDTQKKASGELTTRFRLNPKNQVGSYQIKVVAIDNAKNQSEKLINLVITPPTLTIDATQSTETTSITGNLNPAIPNTEITIIRERDGQPEIIGKEKTDFNGNFALQEVVQSDSLMIKNAQNQDLFEINQITGSIKPLLPEASIQLEQAENPGDNTRIILFDKSKPISALVKNSDINQDAEIIKEKPSNQTIRSSSHTFVYDEDPKDKFELTQIPGSNPDYAGGIYLKIGDSVIVIFDTNGGIKLLSPELRLKLQSLNDLTQYQWFEIYYQDKKIISSLPTQYAKELEITSRIEAPKQANIPPSSRSESLIFQDVSSTDPNAEIINFLKDLGVIEGVLINGERYFEPKRLITRAEYAKIMLAILCIEPRAEAYLAPSVFHDIPFPSNPANLPWYYPQTKESNLLHLFTGYLGEINPQTKLPPFKPHNSITMAEATKVILEALELTKIISLPQIPVVAPWYTPYIIISQKITPYLTTNITTSQEFVLTPAEAATPNKFITREEFAVIAYRTIMLNSCLLTDNLDSLPQALLPPSTPTDHTNSQPTSSAPIASSRPETAAKSPEDLLAPGIYLSELECLTCPCENRYEVLATFQNSDKVYAVIQDPETAEILQKSSEINL